MRVIRKRLHGRQDGIPQLQAFRSERQAASTFEALVPEIPGGPVRCAPLPRYRGNTALSVFRANLR
jgi:hypothetical protein